MPKATAQKKTALKSPPQLAVTRHDLIADVVEKYPGADEILMDFGVGCFNCHVSEFETLEQGILGHGFTEEELEMVITDLNELANKSPDSSG